MYILSDPDIPVKDISRTYSVSNSVLNRIKRSLNWYAIKDNMSRFIKIYWSQKQNITKLITDFVHNTDITLVAKEIAEYRKSSMNANNSVSFIRRFMKTQMRLSFKRVKSRPDNVNLQKIESIRKLFTVTLSKSISKNTLLINIDESSINRSVKTLYSCSFRGV